MHLLPVRAGYLLLTYWYGYASLKHKDTLSSLIHIKFMENTGMKKSAHTLFASVYCAAPLFFFVAGGGGNFVTTARAACVSGAQCEANGFAETPANNDSFKSIGPHLESAALKAINGGTITGSDLTIDSATGGSQYGAYVDSNGQITLTGNATTITGDRGIRSQGGGSFTMLEGKIDTSESAVEVGSDGDVTLTDVTIEKGSGTGMALQIGQAGDNNASLTMTGGSITTSSGGVAVSGTNNHATLTNVTVGSANGLALFVNGSDDTITLTLNGGTTVTDTGNSGGATVQLNRGKLVMDDAHLKITDNRGISMGVSSATANLDAKNFSIESTANVLGYHAIQIGMNSKAKLADGSISTSGERVNGIWITADNQIDALVADNVTFTVSGLNAHGVSGRSGTATLTNSHFFANGQGSIGIYSDSVGSGDHSIINMTGGDITANGDLSRGVWAVRGGEAHLDDVTITTTAANASGVMATGTNSWATFKNGTINAQRGFGAGAASNALVEIDASQITASETGLYAVTAQQQSVVSISNGSVITATGAGGIGLDFLGLTATNVIDLKDSQVSAQAAGAFAVQARGGDDRLDATNSVLTGDRLVTAINAADTDGTLYGAKLDINANNSVLTGHAAVSNLSTLTMNLTNGTDWTLRQSATGTVRSDVTFLNLDESRIVFDPASAQRQTLVVGSGDRNGNTTVYNAFANARIEMNTFFDAGGPLASQSTDRLIINGDVTGTTLLTVNPVAGSPGAPTGLSASDGISIVQVYGNASANSFALSGGYVAVGPYQYHLAAFDPTSSDTTQRVMGSGGFWDFRLQNPSALTGTPPPLLPQIPSYLSAPNALFQARMLDISTLRRRLGETSDCRHTDTVLPQPCRREFFLRTYGGNYTYQTNRSVSQNGFDADVRYTAVQGGGNFYGVESEAQSLRIGLAGSYGDLAFEPHRVPGSRQTKMDVWSVSPTLTWQHANGGYVDALIAVGGFKGDVSTRQRGKTATLQGRSIDASIGAGMPVQVASLTVEPQIQAVYQRLKFNRTIDADGLTVDLGTQNQWTLRAGNEFRKRFVTKAGSAIRVSGKLHLVHTPNDRKKARLGDRFRLGKSGTVVEAGLGVDAALAGGKTMIYADVTRQQRSSRAGHQGWSANLGVKVRF